MIYSPFNLKCKRDFIIIRTVLFVLFFTLFFHACSDSNTIKQPPFILPSSQYSQKNSVIQVPIQIDTRDIRNAILREVPDPLSSGSTDKITTKIFASKKIRSKELIKEYKNIKKDFFKPLDSSYKYITNDAIKHFDTNSQLGVWIKHHISLQDLKIVFEGSLVKIYTSYKIDIYLDYEQSVLPQTHPIKIKGLLKGTTKAEIHLIGEVNIDKNAQLKVKAFQDKTKVKFTKIALPSSINILELLKITQVESFLTKKLLEEPVNKYVFTAVQKQITAKSKELNLPQKIQDLVYENSQPLKLSKDLWLVPKPYKVSVAQISTNNKLCSNMLFVNVGIQARPKLVTSNSKPSIENIQNIPIACEPIKPRIYLYPSFALKYNFVAPKIETALKKFLKENYKDKDYTIKNVKIYPSDTKLVIALDLIKKTTRQKLLSFYLWGEPTLNTKAMNISVKNLNYTLETENKLLSLAHWVLDAKIKNIIQKHALFSYKSEYNKLAQELSSIKYTSKDKIISGNITIDNIQNIFLSQDALIVDALATGDLSYTINLKE